MSESGDSRYVETAFLMRIAHELRGPAGVIQGSLGEISAALGDDAERYRRLLAMAERGVARVLRTATLLEQTGQLAAGDVTLERQPCDLRDLARAALERAKSIEVRRKVEVELELPDRSAVAAVDPEWMTIALAEIASNAIRHATRRVRAVVEASGDRAGVVLIDDGAPFTPFAPVRFEPPPERRGHGLALAIARDVIAAHGGALTIERTGTAESGETRVGVHLPAARGAVREPPGARVS